MFDWALDTHLLDLHDNLKSRHVIDILVALIFDWKDFIPCSNIFVLKIG